MPARINNIRTKIFISALTGALFLITPNKILGQIRINEFSSDTSSDWVEIYNDSDNSVDLSEYSLVDGSTSGNPKSFNCILAAKGWTVTEWSNKLNHDGDIIKLKSGENVTDCVSYGNWTEQFCSEATQVTLAEIKGNEVGARNPDGNGTWIVTTTVTKDGPNGGGQKDSNLGCFMPSPSPAPSPSPSSTPSPSPEPSPSRSPSPTPLPSKSPSPKPSPSSPSIALGTGSLGVVDPSFDPEENLIAELATPEGEVLGETEPATKAGKTKNPYLLSFGLIGLGLALMATTVVVFTKSNHYNKPHDTQGKI
ncbi:MAG: lamin tail domain-containing protein [Candidatus Beckwithbacteria bacterium]|nr:lamin tail domain-containing protein [Candidatus Beckwithbacteria bacterium]